MAEQQDDAVLRITAQYVSELQAGRQPRLSEYLARYPQYAEEIADFVAYYHIAEMQAADDLTLSPPLSEASQSILEQLQAEDTPILNSLSITCSKQLKVAETGRYHMSSTDDTIHSDLK